MSLVVNNIVINRRDSGLYSLTECWKAMGGSKKHKAAFFIRGAGSHYEYSVSRGRHTGGTECGRDAIVAYIEWIGNKEKYIRVIAEREKGALSAIEQILGIKLERQFRVGNYRIDGYCIETNTAYEIDEKQHLSIKNSSKDIKRQLFIESELGCKFVRIKV